jgi:hypothetical protein
VKKEKKENIYRKMDKKEREQIKIAHALIEEISKS